MEAQKNDMTAIVFCLFVAWMPGFRAPNRFEEPTAKIEAAVHDGRYALVTAGAVEMQGGIPIRCRSVRGCPRRCGWSRPRTRSAATGRSSGQWPTRLPHGQHSLPRYEERQVHCWLAASLLCLALVSLFFTSGA